MGLCKDRTWPSEFLFWTNCVLHHERCLGRSLPPVLNLPDSLKKLGNTFKSLNAMPSRVLPVISCSLWVSVSLGKLEAWSCVLIWTNLVWEILWTKRVTLLNTPSPTHQQHCSTQDKEDCLNSSKQKLQKCSGRPERKTESLGTLQHQQRIDFYLQHCCFLGKERSLQKAEPALRYCSSPLSIHC